jgi:predicted dehydrogenase
LRAPHIADDDTVITIEHTSGVISELAVSALAPHLAPRFRVLGNRAGLVIEGLDEQENALRDGERPTDDNWGTSSRTVQIHRGDSPVESQPLDRGRWDLFYPAVNAAINGVSEPPVSPLSAVATIDLLERAVLSARSGQWVDCT